LESTRIYQVLRLMERKELNRFRKFINSPYFNINPSIIQLGEALIDQLKSDEELPSKPEIWAHINSGVDYDDLKFRKLCNDLLERFERFLVNEKLEEVNLLQANLLLYALRDKKIDLLVDKQVKKSNRLIDREIDQSAEYYLRVYTNKKILLSLKTNSEKKADIKNSLDKLSYEDLFQNLDSFYVVEKLRYATDILSWKKMYKTDIDLDLGFTLDLVEKYNLEAIPAVKVYVLMYRLMSGIGNYDDYNELKSFAGEVIENFPLEEQREIVDVLLSFVIKDVNKGDMNAVAEMVSLYEWSINEEIILHNGHLSPTTFRNYVVGGLRLGLYDKVEKFIKSKARLLEESDRENAINFNMSRVEFYRKDFDKALVYLNKVNYDDIWYSINSRNNLLAVYYELKEFEVLESQMDSYSTYLRREKSIEGFKKVGHQNYVNFLRSIYRNMYNNIKLQDIKANLKSEKSVFNKSWLLEKIDELL